MKGGESKIKKNGSTAQPCLPCEATGVSSTGFQALYCLQLRKWMDVLAVGSIG
jgi:hypothetical protein